MVVERQFKLSGGASDVKAQTAIITATQTARKTLITPTSGKRVRVISVMFGLALAADTTAEVYFGTAAGIDTTPTKAIARGTVTRHLTNDTSTDLHPIFPDGGGPIGAVDEVVSHRVVNAIDYHITVIYREE